jgi:hypothetical protein
VYYSLFIDYLVRRDLAEIPPHVNLFVHAVPYLVVANQAILYSDLENGMQLLARDFGDSPAAQTLRRMKNEQELRPKAIITTSLPLLLQYAIGNSQILEYSSLKLFSVSDSDRDVDFDFSALFSAAAGHCRNNLRSPSKQCTLWSNRFQTNRSRTCRRTSSTCPPTKKKATRRLPKFH